MQRSGQPCRCPALGAGVAQEGGGLRWVRCRTGIPMCDCPPVEKSWQPGTVLNEAEAGTRRPSDNFIVGYPSQCTDLVVRLSFE